MLNVRRTHAQEVVAVPFPLVKVNLCLFTEYCIVLVTVCVLMYQWACANYANNKQENLDCIRENFRGNQRPTSHSLTVLHLFPYMDGSVLKLQRTECNFIANGKLVGVTQQKCVGFYLFLPKCLYLNTNGIYLFPLSKYA